MRPKFQEEIVFSFVWLFLLLPLAIPLPIATVASGYIYLAPFLLTAGWIWNIRRRRKWSKHMDHAVLRAMQWHSLRTMLAAIVIAASIALFIGYISMMGIANLAASAGEPLGGALAGMMLLFLILTSGYGLALYIKYRISKYSWEKRKPSMHALSFEEWLALDLLFSVHWTLIAATTTMLAAIAIFLLILFA